MDNLIIVESIGVIAAMLTAVAWMPQTIKTLKTKSTKDISLRMMLVMNLGIMLWLIYGISVSSVPIIIANGITLPLSMSILAAKFKYK